MSMKLQDYLKEHILVTDGAMGTYYGILYPGEGSVAEDANLKYPERILRIHKEYIAKGAKLLRTNTFALNAASVSQFAMDCQDVEGYIAQSVKAAVSLARRAAAESGEQVFIAADIGPIPQKEDSDLETEEYERMIDLFLELGMDVFVMETFSEVAPVRRMARYIRKKAPEACIIGQFSINPTGYSQMGHSVEHMLRDAANIPELDVCGLNCSIGVTHMLKFLGRMELPVDKYISALPNCGYPHVVRGKTVYSDSVSYYGERMEKIIGLGVNMVGGCCGTTPEYISEIEKRLGDGKPFPRKKILKSNEGAKGIIHSYPIIDKMNEGKKVIAVELDPPFDEDPTRLIEGAFVLKEKGVDMITIADSPMARSRADSLLVASKLKRDVGVTVLPHFTCRDRNRIAVRSSVLGAYMNEIRNMLIITGDPVGPADRDNTKGVFDFNSIRMMEFIRGMNEEHFGREPICIGGAINQNSSLDALIARTEKKIKAGASFFLSQPLYDKESIDKLKQVKEALHTKILFGIMPLVSYRNAMFIRNEMPGMYVPEEVVNKYRPDMTKEEAEAVAVSVSLELIDYMKDVADGYYFMTPFNRVSLIGRIIDEIKKNEE